MGNFAASGVSGQFLHEIPILTTPLIGGGVFEVKILLDIVGLQTQFESACLKSSALSECRWSTHAGE